MACAGGATAGNSGNSGGGGAGSGTGANSDGVALPPTNVSVQASRRFTMEGVGSRVIRGPDWKWGKQILEQEKKSRITINKDGSQGTSRKLALIQHNYARKV